MPKSKARSTEVPSRQAGNKQDAIAPTVYILSTKDIINSCHRQVAKNIYWIQIQVETLRKVDETFLFIYFAIADQRVVYTKLSSCHLRLACHGSFVLSA